MGALGTVVDAVALALPGLGLYATGGGYLPFVAALGSVRLRSDEQRFVRRSFDAVAMLEDIS